MNWVGSAATEPRTAGCEKWSQLPAPEAKPSTTKPVMTISLVEVSTFCTLAVRPTPKQLSAVKAAINAAAANWPAPRRTVKIPEPRTSEALACFRLGKKYPRESEKATAAAARGAEKPAKKETQPVMKPHSGPKACVR